MLLWLFPVPRGRLFGEVEKRSGDGRIPLNEVPIVPREPEELSHLLEVARWGPISYSLDLGVFHLHLVVFYAHPEEVDVRLFELALVDVEEEAVLL